MSTQMPEFNLDLHCNINEKAFSCALFLCRLFTAAALIYMALGSLLYWREFLVNTATLGLPHAVTVSFLLMGMELLIGLFLLLGWYTRWCALIAWLLSLICAVIFFLGQLNNIFVALCLLLCAPISVLVLLGAGAISLDYKRSQRAVQKILRG